MAQRTFASYKEFFSFYLEEHSAPGTRTLHAIGTLLGIAVAIVALASGHPLYVLAWPVISYGFAWTSHFLVEHNHPATFGHPIWSLLGDFHMLGLMMTGQLSGRLEKNPNHSSESRKHSDPV